MLNPGHPLPTHLDFTTLYAAALALDGDARKREGLPLSRLLALSQLIESVVLHESLQYELGRTPHRGPYREALENSIVAKLPSEFGVPLLPADEQVDAEESFVVNAMKETFQAVKTVPMELLHWATRMRKGTYASLSTIPDHKNPQLERYIEIARSIDDPVFQEDFGNCLSLLNDNEVGPLGFLVLMRLRLHEAFWVAGGRANYYPHFSRQPVLAKLEMSDVSIEKWTMAELAAARGKIIACVTPGFSADPLPENLSPIFLACVARAKTPEDIIDEANALRNSDAAVSYRRERDEVVAACDGDARDRVMLYKTRLAVRIGDLRELLFERGSAVTREKQSSWGLLPRPSLGWNSTLKRTHRVDRFPGDEAAVFLGDVISQSLGLLKTADKIREIFHVRAEYDTSILGVRG